MRSYIFRVVSRRQDGTIGPTLDQRSFQAPDDNAAIDLARTFDPDFVSLDANAVYLAGADGQVIWSLHAAGTQSPAGRS